MASNTTAVNTEQRGVLSKAFVIGKETISEWQKDGAMRLAASLAFYTILSLAPLLVVAVSVAGLVFGADAARGEITRQFSALMGTEGASATQAILASASKPSSGIIGTVVGVVVLLFGASGVFTELQESLNLIWEVKPKPNLGIKGLIRDRVFSFAMVLSVGFLLLTSLILSAVLSGVGSAMENELPGGAILWQVCNFLLSFGVITFLFALIYKVVPDAKVAWGDVWVGAAVTALLFTIGKLVIGLYLGKASVGSAYGAAGSLVVLVVWVYYSSQILFLGAEFTQVYAVHHGSRIEPSSNAIREDDPEKTAALKDAHA